MSPSGRGAQATSDRVNLAVEKKFTSRLMIAFRGMYEIRNDESGEVVPVQGSRELNRDYMEVRSELYFKLTEEWTISASYHHARRENTNLNNFASADKNVMLLSLQYVGAAGQLISGF